MLGDSRTQLHVLSLSMDRRAPCKRLPSDSVRLPSSKDHIIDQKSFLSCLGWLSNCYLSCSKDYLTACFACHFRVLLESPPVLPQTKFICAAHGCTNRYLRFIPLRCEGRLSPLKTVEMGSLGYSWHLLLCLMSSSLVSRFRHKLTENWPR